MGDVEDEQMQKYEEERNACGNCGPLEAQNSRNIFDHTFVSFETRMIVARGRKGAEARKSDDKERKRCEERSKHRNGEGQSHRKELNDNISSVKVGLIDA